MMTDRIEVFADELADAAERGELKPVKEGARYGAAAQAEARALLMHATGTNTPEDAARVALGRPRVGEVRTETRQWRVRVPEQLDDAARAAAARDGVSVSDVIRLAVTRGLATPSVDVEQVNKIRTQLERADRGPEVDSALQLVDALIADLAARPRGGVSTPAR